MGRGGGRGRAGQDGVEWGGADRTVSSGVGWSGTGRCRVGELG